MFENIFSRRNKLVKPPEPGNAGELRNAERKTLEALSQSYSPVPDVTHEKEKFPYENVLAGNFIFALGQTLGAAAEKRAAADKGADALSVNYVQQTRMDTFSSDLMATSKHRGFLLEFKKNWDERKTERGKPKFEIIKHDEQLVELAKKCHLLGYADAAEKNTEPLQLRFGIYTEIVDAEKPNRVKVWDFPCFLKAVVDHQIGGSYEEFKAYLNRLFRAFTEYFERQANTEEERVAAKRKCEARRSAVSGVAIIYEKGNLYPVSFSSIMGIEEAIGLSQKIQSHDRTVGHEIRPDGYKIGPKIQPDDHNDRGHGISI